MGLLVDYLLESALVLGLLVGFYYLFLHRKPNFVLNRTFLIFSLIASVFTPFLHLGIPQVSTVSEVNGNINFMNVLAEVTIYPEEAKKGLIAIIQSISFYHYIYGIGLFILLFRMYLGFLELEDLSRARRWKTSDGLRIAYLPGTFSAFSFFNLIFINKSQFSEDQLDMVIDHERAHVRYKHSFDVIFMEFLVLFQWFNPFVWIVRGLLREVHEYQVDRHVLDNGVKRGEYKMLILNQSAKGYFLPVSRLSTSFTKKRFSMMNMEHRTNSSVLIIGSLLFLLTVLMLFSFDRRYVSVPKILVENEIQSNIFKSDALLSLGGTTNDHVHVSSNQKMTEAKKVYFTMDEYNGVEEQPNQLSKRNTTGSELADNTKVFYIVDQMPEFPGGQLALRKFLGQEVQYPSLAQEQNISGKVYINFVVEKDGSVANVVVAKGVHPTLDEEALRVVQSSPKWEPGKHDGEFVRVSYTVPISFILK